jgi:hypothetical protein
MNFRRAVVITVVIAILVVFTGALARGAQSEYDTIGGVMYEYLDAWNDAVNNETPIPSSIETEAQLVDIWNATVEDSACEAFAGYGLGVVTLLGIYGETDAPAYLQAAVVLMGDIETLQYDCLIEA